MTTEQKIKEAFDAKYGDVSHFNCLEDYQDLLSTFRAGYLSLLNSHELEQRRKDAERYRWLRNKGTGFCEFSITVDEDGIESRGTRFEQIPECLDAAIDKAMESV